MVDVAVLGGGIAGMATAARLQVAGLSTIVLEAHGQPGGCAGYFRRRGFAFDVGATTLVDFSPGGVGGDFLKSVDLEDLAAEELPGYRAWLPDRQVTLNRDTACRRTKLPGRTLRIIRFCTTTTRRLGTAITCSSLCRHPATR